MDDPFSLFDHWFEEAQRNRSIKEANAANLATTSIDGKPSNRMVLIKERKNNAFVFYTNTQSRKGQQLSENPYAALCFYWEPLFKQIRIEGKIIQVSSAEADKYFSTRPYKSRLGAWASRQSEVMDTPDALMKNLAGLTLKYVGKEIPRPPFWSGFRLDPDRIEFWKKGEYRLHDRVLYCKTPDSQWSKSLLFP